MQNDDYKVICRTAELAHGQKHSSFMILKLYADEKVYTHNSITVWKNARTSKTKMYKQKSDELSSIAMRYMHKTKKHVPDLFLK